MKTVTGTLKASPVKDAGGREWIFLRGGRGRKVLITASLLVFVSSIPLKVRGIPQALCRDLG